MHLGMARLQRSHSYLHLYRMISSLFASLRAPIFLPSCLDKLHYRTIQTVEIYSGMFPPSDTNSVQHQLIHLARHVRLQGPLKCFSALCAERAMHSIKKKVRKGGVSWDKTSPYRIFEAEKTLMQKRFNDEFQAEDLYFCRDKVTGRYEYNEFPVKVLRGRGVLRLTAFNYADVYGYQKAQFLDFVIEESMRLYQVSANYANQLSLIKDSSLYRLYMVFKAHHSKRYRRVFWDGEYSNGNTRKLSQPRFCCDTEFYYWIADAENSFDALSGAGEVTMMNIQKQAIKDAFQHDEIVNAIAIGKLLLATDLNDINHWLRYLDSRHRHYCTAVTWGTKLYARESKLKSVNDLKREGYHPRKCYNRYAGRYEVTPSNTSNFLSNIDLRRARRNRDMSAWCRVHRYANPDCQPYTADTNSPTKKFAAAQMNYFTIIDLPSEIAAEPVNHLPIASITLRKTLPIGHATTSSGKRVFYENLWEINCDDIESFDWNGNSFVALFNIYPTPVATLALGDHDSPLDGIGRRPQKLIQFCLERNREAIFENVDVLNVVHPYHNRRKLDEIKASCRNELRL